MPHRDNYIFLKYSLKKLYILNYKKYIFFYSLKYKYFKYKIGEQFMQKDQQVKRPDTENGNDYFTERRNLKNANAISGITIDRSYCFL